MIEDKEGIVVNGQRIIYARKQWEDRKGVN